MCVIITLQPLLRNNDLMKNPKFNPNWIQCEIIYYKLESNIYIWTFWLKVMENL